VLGNLRDRNHLPTEFVEDVVVGCVRRWANRAATLRASPY